MEGSVPARTLGINNITKSTGTRQTMATARTRPGTECATAIRAISFRKRANSTLYQSRQEQSCLKVIQRATCKVSLPTDI